MEREKYVHIMQAQRSRKGTNRRPSTTGYVHLTCIFSYVHNMPIIVLCLIFIFSSNLVYYMLLESLCVCKCTAHRAYSVNLPLIRFISSLDALYMPRCHSPFTVNRFIAARIKQSAHRLNCSLPSLSSASFLQDASRPLKYIFCSIRCGHRPCEPSADACTIELIQRKSLSLLIADRWFGRWWWLIVNWFR